MLNENIQKCQLKIIDQLDHVSPSDTIQKFESQSRNSILISNFVQLDSKNIQDYFPNQEISKQDIQILKKDEIFSARVILMDLHFRRQFKIEKFQFQSICSQQNQVYKRFIKLKGQYGERFLNDIGLVDKRFIIKNYKYYLFQVQKKLHQKQKQQQKQKYQYLEYKHDYIQWMFPNHFQSMFNSGSWPMSYFEVRLFRQSRKLGLKILKSVRIFFHFLGIQLQPDYSYKIISEQRLQLALLIHSHNHLRLRRILACLSITGFRNIALSLIKFLGQLVRTNTSYRKLKFTFERQWEIYGNKNLQNALNLCFHPEDSFPQTHQVWKQLRSELGLNTQQVPIDWNQYDKNQIQKLTQILKEEKAGRVQIRNFSDSSDQQQEDNKIQKRNNEEREKTEEKNNQVKKQQNIQKQSEMKAQSTNQIVSSPTDANAIITQKIQTPQQNEILNQEIKGQQMVDQNEN